MEAVLAWAGIVLARHIDAVYPLLVPGAVALVYTFLPRHTAARVRALTTALTLSYASYTLCLILGAWFLAWQFSGGGGPLLRVHVLVPIAAVFVSILWLLLLPRPDRVEG